MAARRGCPDERVRANDLVCGVLAFVRAATARAREDQMPKVAIDMWEVRVVDMGRMVRVVSFVCFGICCDGGVYKLVQRRGMTLVEISRWWSAGIRGMWC